MMALTTVDELSSEPPNRVARRRNQKVHDILTATANVLAERGYHETSLDEIAERLDLTKASLYHYFAGKEALVSACLESVGGLVTERLATTAADRTGTASERLTALIVVQLDSIVREHPQMARLFLQPLDWPEPFRERTKLLRQQHDEVFRTVIREGVANGEFGVIDEDVAVHCLHGAMNYVPVWFRPKRKKDYEEMYMTVATSLLRLFSPQPA
jgi:AcrR family transcriptional regulator